MKKKVDVVCREFEIMLKELKKRKTSFKNSRGD